MIFIRRGGDNKEHVLSIIRRMTRNHFTLRPDGVVASTELFIHLLHDDDFDIYWVAQ